MHATRLIRGVALLSSLALFGYTAAAAQHPVHGQAGASNVSHSPRSSESSRSDAHEFKVTSFRGIAEKLNTTPQALESAYQAALAANPKLTRGQFIAANVLAHNLGTKDPSITVQAILDGLKSGNSIGQTLQSLGLSEKDADQANDAATSAIRQAGQEPQDSTK